MNVLWLDGMCYPDVRKKFGADGSHGVFAIDYGKDKIFVLDGEFSYNNLDRFVSRSLRGVGDSGPIPGNAGIPQRSCAVFKKHLYQTQKSADKDL